MRSSSTDWNSFFDCTVVAYFFIPWKTSKNSGVANFFSASSLLVRIRANELEIHPTASSSFASGTMNENAATTGSELKSWLEEGL